MPRPALRQLRSDRVGQQQFATARAAVEAFGSPRVRYLRTPALLSMPSSWDFALSHACGEYVILLGDDDALLPHALAELNGLTTDLRPKAVRWEPAFYTWPSFPVAGQGGYLRVPVRRGIREVEGMVAVRDVVAFREPPGSLPSVYHGAVRRDVLDELRAKGGGRVFPHRYAAIYAGFAVAAAAGKFVAVDAPMSVYGQSAGSLSAPRLFRRDLWPEGAEFRMLNARDGLISDSRVPDLLVFPHAPVADAFLAAGRTFFPAEAPEVNWRQLAAGCVSNLRPETEEDWRAGLAAVREALAADPAARAWFEGGLGRTPFRAMPPPRVRPARLGCDDGFLHLDAGAFGVSDVAGASELCERLLNYRRDGARLDSRGGVAAELADLRRTVVRQSQEIETLQRGCDERAALVARMARQRSLIVQAASWVKRTWPAALPVTRPAKRRRRRSRPVPSRPGCTAKKARSARE